MDEVNKKEDVACQIEATESEITRLAGRLTALRRQALPLPVKNYAFYDLTGAVTLEQLFGSRSILFAIHNMGQACRYCTLWADGLNGFLPHLEDRFSVALLSKDPPETQRRFANTRGWRFRMASHGGADYISEQSVEAGSHNAPGLVCYERKDGTIFRKNAAPFGPNDLFCALWPMIGLAGQGTEDWTPQYSYWRGPVKTDEGGDDAGQAQTSPTIGARENR
jgi:predicted dithiol-disulfide oxidoreductase (DUF899 family)